MEWSEIPVIIPAWNPDARLCGLLDALTKAGVRRPVIVDDGSRDGSIFEKLSLPPEGALVRHAVNLGKGRALKDGFNYCLCRWPEAPGCVTADADGQYLPGDIEACMRALTAQPDALILGARDFHPQTVTTGSRWNNKVACLALRALCGIVLTDAQTGLRAIPASYMRFLLTVPGERFEFETNMLIELRGRCPLREIPARRVALSGGGSSRWSHFSTDSLRIYAVLAMFALSSLGSTIVDLLLFQIFVQLFGRVWPGFYIAAATVGARICSATMNFYLNRTVVFRSRENAAHTALKYFFCSAVQMACSALLVTKLHTGWGGSELMVKMFVDFLLFFVNFQVQRNFVFHRKGDPPGPIGRFFAFLKRRLIAKKQKAGRAA